MRYGHDYDYGYPEYVSVGQRKLKANRQINKLKKQGITLQPVTVTGRKIARKFWGEAWCRHLESLSDYENRLPRGRSYVRNGLVLDLDIQPGKVKARVSGSDLYNIQIVIKPLHPDKWEAIRRNCAGRIGSMLELLRGKLSDEVMAVVTERRTGLFPLSDEIEFKCDCPDWASMCKHVAAVLYGVGARLDDKPELLFTLRKVDAQELIGAEIGLGASERSGEFCDDDLSELFGIEIDAGAVPVGANSPDASPAGSDTDTECGQYPLDERGLIVFTGQAILSLRKQFGLSQTAFARLIRVKVYLLRRWESDPGKRLELALSTQVELETLVKFGLG